MKKFTSTIVAGLVVFAPAATISAANAANAAATAASIVAGVGHLAPTTTAQEQAIRKAKSYLRYTSFSRKGLIEQLKYEGFTSKASTRAVDSLRVNWNKQAAKKAKSYLRYTAFSRKGLIEQLKYEGFTTSQANYGVRSVGL